jgi:PBP1b-binding outer membrane lipoprotein LpoB
MPNPTTGVKTQRVTVIIQFTKVISISGGSSVTGAGTAQVVIDDMPADIGLEKLTQAIQSSVEAAKEAGLQVTRVSLAL